VPVVHPLTRRRPEYAIAIEGGFGLTFDYGEEETMEIEVCRAIRNPRAVVPPGGELDPQTFYSGCQWFQYCIHAGYRRVLFAFLQEIGMVCRKELPVDECGFRGRYLAKVLDSFVKELEHHQRKSESFLSPEAGVDFNTVEPHLFRSRVLNPILQRQLRGIPDNEPEMVKKAVGTTIGAAQDFYLSLDPLHPNLARRMLKNLLYISPVRSSLVFFNREVCEDSWEKILHNTTFMQNNRAEYLAGAWDEEMLYDFEIEIIRLEDLVDVYQSLIDASVSSRVDSINISSQSYPVSSGHQKKETPPSCHRRSGSPPPSCPKEGNPSSRHRKAGNPLSCCRIERSLPSCHGREGTHPSHYRRD